MMKHLSKSELELDEANYSVVNNWLKRGDGIAVYENQDPDSVQMGHRQYVSYGSKAAQLESAEPPQRLPDIGRSMIGVTNFSASTKANFYERTTDLSGRALIGRCVEPLRSRKRFLSNQG